MINSRGTEVQGLDELIKAFMDLPEEAMQDLKGGADEAGQLVLNKTIQKAPETTGNLKEKLKLGKARKSSKYPYRLFSKITVAKGAAYIVPLELGHRLVRNGKKVGTVAEKPFMRPAADESKEQVADVMAKYLNKALEKWGDK